MLKCNKRNLLKRARPRVEEGERLDFFLNRLGLSNGRPRGFWEMVHGFNFKQIMTIAKHLPCLAGTGKRFKAGLRNEKTET